MTERHEELRHLASVARADGRRWYDRRLTEMADAVDELLAEVGSEARFARLLAYEIAATPQRADGGMNHADLFESVRLAHDRLVAGEDEPLIFPTVDFLPSAHLLDEA